MLDTNSLLSKLNKENMSSTDFALLVQERAQKYFLNASKMQKYLHKSTCVLLEDAISLYKEDIFNNDINDNCQ